MKELTDAGHTAELVLGSRRKAWRIYELARQDRIPHVRLGERSIRFDLAVVRAFLAAGGSREPGSWRRWVEAKVGSTGVNR